MQRIRLHYFLVNIRDSTPACVRPHVVHRAEFRKHSSSLSDKYTHPRGFYNTHVLILAKYKRTLFGFFLTKECFKRSDFFLIEDQDDFRLEGTDLCLGCLPPGNHCVNPSYKGGVFAHSLVCPMSTKRTAADSQS